MLTWFADLPRYLEVLDKLRDPAGDVEVTLRGRTSFAGWCAWCQRETNFSLPDAVRFGESPNLREGMRCARCKLTNRQRLVACAIAENLSDAAAPIALMEKTTRLYRTVKSRYPTTLGSEYLGPDKQSGRAYLWRSSALRLRYTTHQDIAQLSYASASLTLIAHSDVLEHVYDYRRALRECLRVLKPGGTLLFTVPFFHDNSTSVLRGQLNADGSLTHFAPPEYHGDGLARGGIYTFHSFGRDLVKEILAAGFSHAEIGIRCPSMPGLASPNVQDELLDISTMIFRAKRTGG